MLIKVVSPLPTIKVTELVVSTEVATASVGKSLSSKSVALVVTDVTSDAHDDIPLYNLSPSLKREHISLRVPEAFNYKNVMIQCDDTPNRLVLSKYKISQR